MSSHVLTSHAAADAGVALRMHSAVKWVSRLMQAISNRIAVHRLSAYDERMLKDIGLVESDVLAALDCPLTEDPSVHLRAVAAGRSRRSR